MNVTVIKSNRKTVAIRVNTDFSITVRAPRFATQTDIERILKEKEPWIRKHMEQMKEEKLRCGDMSVEKLTNEEVKQLADEALATIPKLVKYYAGLVGVTYGRITIRNQRTRWGSCSSKGNLNFNCLLMLTPPEVINYVVVHELCHRREMNHSKAFWSEVEKVIPNYKESVKWLKEEGSQIIKRL